MDALSLSRGEAAAQAATGSAFTAFGPVDQLEELAALVSEFDRPGGAEAILRRFEEEAGRDKPVFLEWMSKISVPIQARSQWHAFY